MTFIDEVGSSAPPSDNFFPFQPSIANGLAKVQCFVGQDARLLQLALVLASEVRPRRRRYLLLNRPSHGNLL
ncbi:hypothetical protein SLE2022_057100 [Rubroshorea leprosula]